MGPATADALLARGLAVDVIPDRYVAEGVIEKLKERDDVRGARVLFARAAGARELLPAALREMGAAVDEIEIYRAVPDLSGLGTLRDALDAGTVDLVTFTSASTVRHFVDALGAERARTVRGASIGPVTSDAARALGVPIEVEAAESTIASLVRGDHRAPRRASRGARSVAGAINAGQLSRMTATVRIATRASELALRQARMVQAALEQRGTPSELVTFKTVGDKKLDEALSAIGAKGLFTKELEDALAAGKVDCCVHSLKDLPTDMPPGLALVAMLEREDPRDVLVVNDRIFVESLDDLPRGSRVGTSSLRRRAQLLHRRSDLEVVELRGNVPTRLRKVDEGQVHAAILAGAGLKRLEAEQRIDAWLDAPEWLPAAGQGVIAVEAREDDARMARAARRDSPRAERVRCDGRARAARGARRRVPGADRRAAHRRRAGRGAARARERSARQAHAARLARGRRPVGAPKRARRSRCR